MNRFKNFLQSNYQIKTTEWDTIQSFFKIKTLRKNDYFIENGKVCTHWGFVLDGVLRYFESKMDIEEHTCYFAFENFCITDPFTFFKQVPSSINLAAVTNCTIAVTSFNSFEALKKEFPIFGDISNDMLLKVSNEFANQKIMVALNASERYDYFVKHYPTLAQRVSLGHIASYLGIAQPSLSRIRKEIGKRV